MPSTRKTSTTSKTDAEKKEVDAAVAGAVGDLTVADPDVHENSEQENQEIVDAATNKSTPEPKDTKPEEPKPLTTGQVAEPWIRAQLEKGSFTKKELNELALKGNPSRLNAKAIVAANKLGKVCPANTGGAYIGEGLELIKYDKGKDGKLSLKK